MMKVPYAGKTGERIVESLKMTLKTNLPDNINCRIVQTERNPQHGSTSKMQSTNNTLVTSSTNENVETRNAKSPILVKQPEDEQ